MSGTIGSNILSHSGIVAETAAGLNWVSDVVTASTVTVESGNGYWINTTSNTCTITLPAEAEAGDNIVIVDFARTWGTNKIIIDSNGLNFQGDADTSAVEYTTDGQSVNLIFSDSTKGWIPLEDDVVADEPVAPPTQRALFGFGYDGSGLTGVTNLVNSSGVVAADVSAVGTARQNVSATNFGGDKAIFGFGVTNAVTGITNLVNNSGVVASDVSAVGTASSNKAAASYGLDKGIFGYGALGNGNAISATNKVSNSGVVASDTTGVGTGRNALAAATYGLDKALFAYGADQLSVKNLVNNAGTVAADITGVGTGRSALGAAGYGGDKAIFGYGNGANTDAVLSMTNLVNNQGVVGSDVSGVGMARWALAAAAFGGDKAIFGYGYREGQGGSAYKSITNLVNSSGVVAANVTGVGSGRRWLAAANYSYSA